MCVPMQFLFPNLVIADLNECIANFCFQILIAVLGLYHCMFKYCVILLEGFISPEIFI